LNLQLLGICFNSVDTPVFKIRKHRLAEKFKVNPVRTTKVVTTTK